MINLDSKGNIIDLYYPHVGMENQSNGRGVEFSIYVDGTVLRPDAFTSTTRYLNSSMIFETILNGKEVTVTFQDFVDPDEPIFYRIISINSEAKKEASIYFINKIALYGNDIGDTAFYEPKSKSIIHYKSKRYVAFKLIGQEDGGVSFTIGKGDAESDINDDKLEGYPIAQGRDVTSIIGYKMKLSPTKPSKAYYAIGFGRNLDDVRNLVSKVDRTNIEASFARTYLLWSNWLRLCRIVEVPEELKELLSVSLFVIRSHLGNNGSLIASSDYSFVKLYGDGYFYCWPRDAAYAAHALDIAGYGDLALRIYRFLASLPTQGGALYHKYNSDGTLASSWHPWYMGSREILPIQEDETALTVWALATHFDLYRDLDDVTELYKSFVRPAMKFMISYTEDGLPKPSFDLWEERYGIHLFTVATVYGALTAGSELAESVGDRGLAVDARDVAKQMKERVKSRMTAEDRLVRRLDEAGNKDLTVDSSLYASFFFGLFSPREPLVVNTMEVVEEKLKVGGGIIRYENDLYQRRKQAPNPWIITTLWLSEHKSALGDKDGAMSYIKWAANHRTPSYMLPEQVDPETGESVSVTPLVWSHAELIIALKSLL
ncbi:glucan 1,3-alpha-glucosidase [Sulfodiicoccus acidiphilus]|uniref:Glucan 1,3-alpha-glucosidase n=1 Tax=Sulfodiicoccus acidiphilus TaxID=1670455 RepID=A0A348B0V1_9CREN|nr:glucan 1,3-alpha-glucosidase [Sulfodiicoccus acidiphilus]GGT99291.1 glucan 1,3-alpha-glucosidase [Sulfodiicoccus acidiphilus]